MDNDLEKLVGIAAPAVGNNTLSMEARTFRSLLPLVKDAGHLRDLVAIFFHHTKWTGFDPDSSYAYAQMCQRLGASDLNSKNLVLGLAVLAPVLQNNGWVILSAEFKAQKKKRDEEYAQADERARVEQARQALITRVDQGSSQHMVRQLWIADTKEQLEVEGAYQKIRYHPGGYGTRTSEIIPGTGEYEGKFTCTFSRGTSAD